MILRILIAVVLVTGATCYAQPAAGPQPTLATVEHGKYWQYVPPSASPASPVLVVCHGMLTGTETADQSALGFLKIWLDFANQTGAVLVAPAFDDENFGGGNGCPHGWGYRGLYGRHVGADEFLHEVVAALQKLNPKYDGRFYLWGHSAGAQFVAHYVVRHPERVHTAVISAPAWLPFPTMDDTWPRSMGPRKTKRRWPGETEDQLADVQPDPKSFLAAAELPLLVTCGALDLEPLKHSDSQGGDTHVVRAQAWAIAMNQYAKSEGRVGKVTSSIVPNIDHSGGKMARSSMPFLIEHMRNNATSTPRVRRGSR